MPKKISQKILQTISQTISHASAAVRSPRIGFYAGSFDPPTLGHGDVIARALTLCEQLVIGVGVNPAKPSALLSPALRIDLITALSAAILSARQLPTTTIRVMQFEGLAIDAARQVGAHLMVRGLRNGSDLDSEMALAGMNEVLANSQGYAIETVFVPTSPQFRMITATLVRQIALLGGDPSPFVDPIIAKALAKMKKSSANSFKSKKS